MKKTILLLSLFIVTLPILSTAQKMERTEVVFSNNSEAIHYAIIRLSPPAKGKNGEIQKLEPLKQEEIMEQVGNLNNNIAALSLRLSQIYLTSGGNIEPVITVRRFQNYQEAKAYCNKFEIALSEQEGRSMIIEVLPISQLNYRACLKQRSSKAYRKYYSEILNIN